MPEHQYEIEIKSLLGSGEKVAELVARMQTLDPKTDEKAESKQLNHYFVDGDKNKIVAALLPHIEKTKQEALKKILEEGKNISLRTRDTNGKVLFVVKASIDDTTSSNGTARLEFEENIPGLSLRELDQLLLDAGCHYQAKWSRERKEYSFRDMTVCLDRNAGYGYLAEFEKIIHDAEDAKKAKKEIRGTLEELGIKELPQERLERMFAHYNAHWPEYYGTDKVFTIQ